jgi:2-oxoglutarate dehydrogenase E1 component
MMYEKIAQHVSVRELWATNLIADGVVTDDEAQALVDDVEAQLVAAREAITSTEESAPDDDVDLRWLTEPADTPVVTAIPESRVRELNERIHSWPEGFALFHKLGRQLDKRRQALDAGIDWAHAEALALAGLVTEAVPIRFTGEDTERGTFSHRHLVLHDSENGEIHTPLAHVAEGQAAFEIANSPLSEIATLGFEYGFSTIAADALVMWEGQFGDFANVGQAIIDQFIVAGRSKWGQESRLVLLLPHGYEGQGPEHSSARLERFLQLSGESNIRVCNCTSPAQYFHLLRLQALRPTRRPLIVMTPKSLLRHPQARSSLGELTNGTFQRVVRDATVPNPSLVDRILLCSGKIYYELAAAAPERGDTAILRLEQLAPFPASELRAALSEYPTTAEICWVQEEPENMGAWTFVGHRIAEASGRDPLYIGRPERASPAEGYAGKHARRQRSLIESALRL